MTRAYSNSSRAFVLGLDGVPWRKLNTWMDAGELPNFRRLRREGAAGPLASTMPPTTALAWPSIATGVWPDKHGIYGFQKLASDYTHSMSTSRDRQHPALWDVLSPAVVGNVPMTYPAEEVDGAMVTGMMTPELNDRFTHPPELKSTILEEVPEYDIGLKWSEYADRPDEFRADLDSLVAARRELMELLMEREEWRLFFFVYTAPDRLQHLLWEDGILLDHYRRLDEILGNVMSYTEQRDANLFVVSDHGFGPVSKAVAVNRVLEQAGCLSRREAGGVRGLLSALGVTKDRVLATLGTAGVTEETVVRALPDRLVDGVAAQVPGSHALYDVDFENTLAFVHGTGCVYVNDTERFDCGVVAPADRAAVADDVRGVFESVTDPETGQSVLRVFDGDDLFETDEHSPDLVVRAIDGYNKVTDLRENAVGPVGALRANHREQGVFLAWGPDVEPESTPWDATVVDVAPTVLHSVGEPVPETTDGDVIDGIFVEDSSVAERTVEQVTPGTTDGGVVRDENFADVEERLRGLGYMD